MSEYELWLQRFTKGAELKDIAIAKEMEKYYDSISNADNGYSTDKGSWVHSSNDDE